VVVTIGLAVRRERLLEQPACAGQVTKLLERDAACRPPWQRGEIIAERLFSLPSSFAWC
jgi:hypothetical protein